MSIQAYLFFDGRCAEAMAFYKEVLGAEEVMSLTFADSPDPHPPGMVPAGWDDKIMHACLRVGDALLMASDGGGCGGAAGGFQGFSLSLSAADEAEAQRIFAAFSEGGEVRMPLGKTFFSPCFGMVADKFGVPWMVNVAA